MISNFFKFVGRPDLLLHPVRLLLPGRRAEQEASEFQLKQQQWRQDRRRATELIT